MMTLRALAAALMAATLALAGCTSEPTGFQGWIEADLVFVGPDEAGRLEHVSVREGDVVAIGASLFSLDDDLQRADLSMQQTLTANARLSFERASELLRTNTTTQKSFDDAQAQLREAEARLEWLKTRLARRRIASPAHANVQQIYFRPGELVTAGKPVVALLPPENLKVRFFVAQDVLPKIAPGLRVTVQCDGCEANIGATVRFVSRQAEFTPPVIFSQDERARMVFMVDAQPDEPSKLRVGQPVTVTSGATTPTGRR